MALVGVIEATRAALAGLGYVALKLLLAVGEIAGLLPGGAHLLGELAGGLALEVVSGLVELFLGASAGSEGLLDVALVELLVGSLHVLSGLLELLASLLALLSLFGGLLALGLGVGLEIF